jgi:hypothetical protein
MMPFIMGDHLSVPEEFDDYIPLIEACNLESEQIGKVGYLSVAESAVCIEMSQRRPGIHTDKHQGAGNGWGGGWGRGNPGAARRDGIYMASTVSNSCRAWDVHIETPGDMGDCEHLRTALNNLEPVCMKADTLYWMTDSCPHESLPLEAHTVRQWFRVVTHKVDLWYSDHSTASPLGIQPACRIISGDKFKQASHDYRTVLP